MPSVINVGVVGCGYWGPNLARNFAAQPDCRLQAVCDADPERLAHMRTLHPEVLSFREFSEFLEQGSLDAVVVATGARHHYPMAKAAILAGKHVLVEKPMAASFAECLDLERHARARGVTLMAGHTFLFSPVVRRIKEIVDSGEIGEIRYISARRLNLGLFQKDINVAWDLAPHDLSIILYIVGAAPLTVNCQGASHVSPGVEDVTSLWLTFSNNISAIVQSSWLDPRKTREMTIVGSKKMIVYDDVSDREKIRIYDTRVAAPRHFDNFAEFQFAYHYGDVTIPYVRLEEPLKVECQHFLQCITEKKRPLTDAVHAGAVVSILEAASQSLERRGTPVDLGEGADALLAAG
jgi:predicted dehydrogenase